jgi:hypothetical protein
MFRNFSTRCRHVCWISTFYPHSWRRVNVKLSPHRCGVGMKNRPRESLPEFRTRRSPEEIRQEGKWNEKHASSSRWVRIIGTINRFCSRNGMLAVKLLLTTGGKTLTMLNKEHSIMWLFSVNMTELMRFRFGRPHLLHKAESRNLIRSAMFDYKKSHIEYGYTIHFSTWTAVLTFSSSVVNWCTLVLSTARRLQQYR